MTQRRRHVWIVFNGEIYNHADAAPRPRSARPPLSHAAATPRPSSTSTKSTASAVVERAPGHVRLRDLGSAAAAPAAGARPPRHQAALLRRHATASSLFASEIKALLAAGRRGRRSTRRCCPSFSPPRFVSGEDDVLPAASASCCPATSLTWSPGDSARHARRYWQLPAPARAARARGVRRRTRPTCARDSRQPCRAT